VAVGACLERGSSCACALAAGGVGVAVLPTGRDPQFAKTIAEVWGKTLASASGLPWAPSKFVPTVTVIMIGHNDFRT
jgi:hypothetical protein